MIGFGSADFGYGNTRLRARRTRLLRAEEYQTLIDLDPDQLLDRLRQRSGAPATTAHDGDRLQQLHDIIRHEFGRALEDMRSFYHGRARELVDILLSGFDAANMITILRGHGRIDTSPDETLRALVPVGWLRQSVAFKIVQSVEMAGVVELMAAALPNRAQARALNDAFRQYQTTEDLAAFERAVLGDHTSRVLRRLGRLDRSNRALICFVQTEADQANILVTLRMRDAIMSGADDTPPPAETLIPGGTIPPKHFAAIRQEPDPAAIVAWLDRQLGPHIRTATERWAANGDLQELQRTLSRNTLANAVHLFVIGDPLGVDIPLAFTAGTQTQARNLRLLAEAAARGLPGDIVSNELILWSRSS